MRTGFVGGTALRRWILGSPALGIAAGAVCAMASAAVMAGGMTASAGDGGGGADGSNSASVSEGLMSQWLATSDAAKEAQPHWMTPLVTVTPRLEEEFRYDQSEQAKPGDTNVDNYGGGKGLEIIPAPNTELILGVPAYQTRTSANGHTVGWADESVLGKYRFAAGNEEQGNYIVTGFLGVSVPTGADAFSNHKAVVTPTLAAGKGWGARAAGVDIQSTLGVSIPVADGHAIGMPITWNTALQAHVAGWLWPEIESTYTAYRDGPYAGKEQWVLSSGLIAGRFSLGSRARLIVGAGYQWPISTFRILDHAWLGTVRIAF